MTTTIDILTEGLETLNVNSSLQYYTVYKRDSASIQGSFREIRVRDSYWRARILAKSGFCGLMRDSFFLIDFGLVVTIYQTSKITVRAIHKL